jgi:hypothetical protein
MTMKKEGIQTRKRKPKSQPGPPIRMSGEFNELLICQILSLNFMFEGSDYHYGNKDKILPPMQPSQIHLTSDLKMIHQSAAIHLQSSQHQQHQHQLHHQHQQQQQQQQQLQQQQHQQSHGSSPQEHVANEQHYLSAPTDSHSPHLPSASNLNRHITSS